MSLGTGEILLVNSNSFLWGRFDFNQSKRSPDVFNLREEVWRKKGLDNYLLFFFNMMGSSVFGKWAFYKNPLSLPMNMYVNESLTTYDHHKKNLIMTNKIF